MPVVTSYGQKPSWGDLFTDYGTWIVTIVIYSRGKLANLLPPTVVNGQAFEHDSRGLVSTYDAAV